MEQLFNPFPNTPFWDRPRFKEDADDNWNVAIKGFEYTDCSENIVEKGEIAHFEQFHLFQQSFLIAFFFNLSKWVYTEERVNTASLLSMSLKRKPFENIVGKEENAGNKHFLLFHNGFLCPHIDVAYIVLLLSVRLSVCLHKLNLTWNHHFPLTPETD